MIAITRINDCCHLFGMMKQNGQDDLGETIKYKSAVKTALLYHYTFTIQKIKPSNNNNDSKVGDDYRPIYDACH
jgi:hypothetical protein